MNRLNEIISSGRAPGLMGFSKDPGCPQVAIPRALRRLEDDWGAKSTEMIKKGAQYSVSQLKEVWINGRKKRKHIMKPVIILFALMLTCFASQAQTVSTRIVGTTVQTNTFVASTVPVKVFLITGYSASQQYIMGFQTNAIPPTGARATFSVPVLADNYYSIDYGYYGADYQNLTLCTSTTPFTYTPGATNATFQAVLRR